MIQLQFGRNCNKETSFDLDLMPTFTQQQLISISLTSQQQPTLTLQSGDIQLNELYDVTLTVDGTSTFELSLSKYEYLLFVKGGNSPMIQFPVCCTCGH